MNDSKIKRLASVNICKFNRKEGEAMINNRIISFNEFYDLLTELRKGRINASLFKAEIDKNGHIRLFDSSGDNLFCISDGKLYYFSKIILCTDSETGKKFWA